MSELAAAGPIPSDAVMPQLDNSYVVQRGELHAIGDDPELLKRINEGFLTADLIEKHIVDSINRVTADLADLSDAIGIPDVTAQVRAAMKLYIRPCAEALAESLNAGETPEQFDARLAALKIKES